MLDQTRSSFKLCRYILTPHSFVALCLANRYHGWRVAFMVLAGIEVLSDFGSCCALVSAYIYPRSFNFDCV